MKLSFALVGLSAGMILASAGMSRAGVITTVNLVGTSGGYDIYDVDLTGYNDVGQPDLSNNTTGLLIVSGTFTAVTGTLDVTTNSSNAKNGDNELEEGGSGIDPLGTSTYVNLDSATTTPPPTRTPNTNTPVTLTGSWFTTSHQLATPTNVDNAPGGYLIDTTYNPTIAEVYVTHGDAFTFTGTYGTFFGTNGDDEGPLAFSSAVPEPASLGVLALGGLALSARRRRA